MWENANQQKINIHSVWTVGTCMMFSYWYDFPAVMSCTSCAIRMWPTHKGASDCVSISIDVLYKSTRNMYIAIPTQYYSKVDIVMLELRENIVSVLQFILYALDDKRGQNNLRCGISQIASRPSAYIRTFRRCEWGYFFYLTYCYLKFLHILWDYWSRCGFVLSLSLICI